MKPEKDIGEYYRNLEKLDRINRVIGILAVISIISLLVFCLIVIWMEVL